MKVVNEEGSVKVPHDTVIDGLQWQSPHTVRMEKNFPMHFP